MCKQTAEQKKDSWVGGSVREEKGNKWGKQKMKE
jgi:hypothetical protein